MIKLKKPPKTEAGFTIVELIIATSVFTLILLGATFSIVEIGRIYIKGFIGSQTNDTARSISDQLTQAIQLTNPATTTNVVMPVASNAHNANQYSFCVNGNIYTYIINQEEVAGGPATFTEYNSGGCTSATIQPGSLPSAWTSGSELLSANMRLTSFTMSQPYPNDSSLYQINFTVAYGGPNVFTYPGGYPPGTQIPNGCQTFNSGGAFCDIVPFSITVQDRL